MKNTVKFLGIIALMAIIMFSMAACRRTEAPSAAESSPAGAAADTAAGGWDAYLSEAEVLINEMVSLLPAAQAGDMNASVRAIEIYSLIEGLETKYTGLTTDNMTEAQAIRLVSLMEKLSGD